MSVFESAAEKGYDFNVVNPENLNILRQKPNSPIAYIFNHSITEDPLFGFLTVRKYAPERLANVIVPVSEKHARFNTFKAYWALTTVGEKVWGFELPRVVQSYRVRKEGPVDDELLQKSSDMGKSLFRVVDERLPSAPLIYLSPEGHRSESGQLLPAEGGAGVVAILMERKMKKGKIEGGYFIPVATTIEGFKGHGFYYNALKKPRVECTIGEPIGAEEAVNFGKELAGEGKADAKVVSHYLMTKIARLMPEERRGVYHPDLVQDTFQGRFGLYSDENDHAFVYDVWNQKRFDLAKI